MILHVLIRRTVLLGLAALLLLLALAAAAVPRVSAHPADMYFHTHTLTLSPDGARDTWMIAPGTLLAYVVWNKADTDRDGAISDAEALAWTEALPDAYLALVDGEPLAWQITGVTWPRSLVDFETGRDAIAVELALAWPAAMPDTAQIAFYNRFEEYNSSNWYTVQAEDGVQFHTPLQKNGALTFQVVQGVAAQPGDGLRTYWDSGTPTIGASGAQVAAPARREQNTSASAQLADLVRRDDLSLTFYLTAFAIAVGLGSLHALTPGHGKALVGAYLVGSRGTMQHAVALGGIVTMTHTGSVLALGMITLAASHILLPTTLFPILEMASGLLVVAMGLGLIYRRYKAWQSVRHARDRAASLRAQMPQLPPELARIPVRRSASAAGGAATPAKTANTSTRIAINQPVNVNVYDDVLPREGSAFGSVNWRALVALGVSGGLVPCPDAIAILLVAVAINRVALGLSLIVAFSLGLAFVLTAIGIAMVRSRRLFEGMDALKRMIPALPLVSALVVTGLGLGLTYNAAARSDLFATRSGDDAALDFTLGSQQQPLDDAAAEPAAAFDINTARVIYLDTDAENRYQLYVRPATGGDVRALTASEFGVWDYKLAPDRSSIAYTTPREFGGSDIWLLDLPAGDPRLALSCEEATCSRVAWSPDGTQLVYEKLEMTSPQSSLGVTTLWWLDIASGKTGPVFRDSQLPSYNPAWSPDGLWLSYIAPGSSSVQIYNLADGRNFSIASQTGNAAVWSPDGSALLVTEIWEADGQYFAHLMRYDMARGTLTDLTAVPRAGDTWATWSPDGTRIAVVRRIYDGPNAAMGDQIWLMAVDGSNAHRLTDTPNVIHGMPVWSPDGRYLIYQRYPLAGSSARPGVWMLDTLTGELAQIAPSGNWPVWLP